MTPEGAAALTAAGNEVLLQAGAGNESGFPDSEYASAGAVVVPSARMAWDAELVVKVKEPLPEEFSFLSEKSSIFTYLHLAAFPVLTDALLEKRVAAIGYETVSVDGNLPLLRPMSEVAGILAVQVGARGLEKQSLERQWRGLKILASRWSPYGNVAVGQRDGQLTFFSNGTPVFSLM